MIARVPHPCRAFCDRMGILTSLRSTGFVAPRLCKTKSFRSLQVCQICLQLLQAEALRSLLLSILVVGAQDRVRFVAVRFPERPGHDLQRSPSHHRDPAGIVSDHGDGVSSPGTRLAIARRTSRRYGPRLMVLHLGLRAEGQLHPYVAAFENINRIHDVAVIGWFERNIRADLVLNYWRQTGIAGHTSPSFAPLSFAPVTGL